MAHLVSPLMYCVTLILAFALLASCATETSAATVSAFLGPEELEQSAQAQAEGSGQP